MAKVDINQGGLNTLWRKDGYLETVEASNQYRLKKAHSLSFVLAPPFEMRYDDDQDFDLTPSGDLGRWSVEFPLTSDMVSSKAMTAALVEADKQTLSYWLYELANKRYPKISFRETMADRNSSPKTMPFNFVGFLTSITNQEADDVFEIKLEGVIQKYVDFEK